jgi:integrase/recombinase XerD
MSTWPDTDRKVIERYLAQLRLRYPISPIYYRQALRSFQDVASRQEAVSTRITRETLETWLTTALRSGRDRRCCIAPASSTASWTTSCRKALSSATPSMNCAPSITPEATKRCCVPCSPRIPIKLSRRCGGSPAFGGVLGDLMRNHISLMRARGYRYQTQARWLWRFDRFLQAHPELSNEPVPVMLRHWAAARRTAKGEASAQLIDHLKKPEMAKESERLTIRPGGTPRLAKTCW